MYKGNGGQLRSKNETLNCGNLVSYEVVEMKKTLGLTIIIIMEISGRIVNVKSVCYK